MIKTERLILRELMAEDAEGMFKLDANPEVHRCLGKHLIASFEQAKEVIEFVRKQYISNGIGRYAMLRKTDLEFIGWCGLKLNTEVCNGFQNYYDLGYRLRQEFWQQGYASEAAGYWRDYAYDTLNLESLYAAAPVDNSASNKILGKLGFEKKNNFYYENELNTWYELSKSKYRFLQKP